MCGRYTLSTPASELVEIFRLLSEPSNVPRYNIAPTQAVATVRRVDSARELEAMQWGLVPSWAKDPKMGARMINARAETVAEKPAFRSAFARRRCLIPADGFYEWKKTDTKNKQPVYIRMRDGRPFAFAGLWETWNADDGSQLKSCTIVTTDANPLLRDIHDRMPVILPADAYDTWLDPKPSNAEALKGLLVPYPADVMTWYPVGTLVNSPRNDNPECIEPLEEQRSLF